jgi:predicted CXXCH cytochrome family protein
MQTKLLNLLKIIMAAASFLLTFEFFNLQTSFAEQPDCLMCHEPLSKEKVVHAALQMGCPTCHSAIDATDIPHKKTNKIAKGLSSDQPDLCYDCHDKSMFSKKVIHPALGMGCTSCHNPHSSKNNKLLVSEPPDLCYNCHDKTKFNGKTVHPPVMGGMCTSCHSPHSSDTEKLLLSKPPALCFNCHDKTTFEQRKPHMPVASGLCLTCHAPHMSGNLALLVKPMFDLCTSCHKTQSSGTHVLAGPRGSHPIKQGTPDPSRTGRDMGCSSCHNPHGADFDKLFYQQGIYKKCHKY